MSFECWIFCHFVWSHHIAASLGNCSLHPIVTAVCVIPSHLNSSDIFSALFNSPNLIPSHVFSPLLSSLSCSKLVFSLRMPPMLFSSLLISSQLFSNFHSSSQLLAAHASLSMSYYLFSPLLTSSKLFWLSSADLSVCQLVSRLSAVANYLIYSLAQSLLQTRISVLRKSALKLSTEKILTPYTHSKLLHSEALHAEAFTVPRQGNLYKETGKLVHKT